MSSSTSESLPPVASADESIVRRPKIIEALCLRVTALTRIVLKEAREVPIVGGRIGWVEDTLSPWVEHVTAHVEKDGLHFLSLVDERIHKVSDVAMALVPFSANFIPQLQAILSGEPIDAALLVLDRVRKRGVVGSTADLWVDYEPIVKSESQKIYTLAVRVPGVRFLVAIVSDVSSPLLSMASEWLVMHSEVKDKHEILLQRGISPSSSDMSETRSKVPEAEETTVADFNSLDDKSDSNLEQPSHPSYAEAVSSTDSKGEIDTIGKLPESADEKGKFPELTVVHEDEEEQDELSDLFNTWGMGVKAVNPRSLSNLRSKSLNEGAGSTKPFTNLSKSFRY